MSDELRITPEQFFGSATALSTAHRIGLTHVLSTAPASAAALARRLDLAERPLQLVLELMVSFDLAIEQGSLYAAGPALLRLQNSIPGGLLKDAQLWAHLPQWLTDDEPLTGIDCGSLQREPLYVGIVGELGRAFTSAARALAPRLRRVGHEVLDVGCGSGVWSLALAEHDPNVHVTGLDFEAVLAVFTERARALGLDNRIATLTGDAHELSVVPGSYDTVLFANVLRLEPAERAKALLRRWAQALRPGGAMVIIDALAAGTPAAERARTLYALHLALRSARATVHTPGAILRFIDEAGLKEPETIDLSDVSELGALGAIVARRRA